MPSVMTCIPQSRMEPTTEILHDLPITDDYRWLEDGESSETRSWIEDQRQYARAYLDNVPGRERIRQRIREFLAVETYDSVQKVGDRYLFRKRLAEQEQPCIYLREGPEGKDRLLIDPAERGTGPHTAVKPLFMSPNGRLLLYEVKQGGERTGMFELLDLDSGKRLPDVLHRGYLRGLVFSQDCRSFYYVHEAADSRRPFYRAAFKHVLGSGFEEDPEIFFAGEDRRIRLNLLGDSEMLVFFVTRFEENRGIDVYLSSVTGPRSPRRIFQGIDYRLGLHFARGRILAITDRNAPNKRIVEIRLREKEPHDFIDLVPESDSPIGGWVVAGDRLFVSYLKNLHPKVLVFDLDGHRIGTLPIRKDETVRLIGGGEHSDEFLFEAESFLEPIGIFRFAKDNQRMMWSRRDIALDATEYGHTQVFYTSKDGTRIPMFLVGRKDVLQKPGRPTIMTSYGGFGVSMTPRFSVFVTFLLEKGCLFALPNIRGGGEFGPEWHNAARREKRQTAIDDFLCAAEWLIQTGRTAAGKLAIFGGSNSGLLVGAALTQRPELFRAVVCMVPMLDMLRYHLFDNAHVWRKEYGTAERKEDFMALQEYSPYHHVRNGTSYPAVMLVSGDSDRNCNPFHARKMTARLQSANASPYPVILDYSRFRGHSPVLPLSDRIDALTDRMAFLCDQLQLEV